MDIFIVPVPVFDKDIAIKSYLLNCNKYDLNVDIFEYYSPAMEAINSVGIEAFTLDEPIFIPISSKMLTASLGFECMHPPQRIVFLFSSDLRPEEPYISHIKSLVSQGFGVAIAGIENIEPYHHILQYCTYFMLDVNNKPAHTIKSQLDILQKYPMLTPVAAEIPDENTFDTCMSMGFSLFEGPFYRQPVTKGSRDIDALKSNLVRLLNIVRNENFEFDIVADTIQRDTALSLSLMTLINSPYIGLSQRVKTISHAVTLLGQNEVRKWATASVSRFLGADKPSEITKLSLTRAKFCENISPLFGMAEESSSLFMMGLFSVFDIILDIPIDKVFEKVLVSDEIYDALVMNKGPFFAVFDFISKYESADWASVEKIIESLKIPADAVYNAYIDSISWYSDLILEEINYKEFLQS